MNKSSLPLLLVAGAIGLASHSAYAQAQSAMANAPSVEMVKNFDMEDVTEGAINGWSLAPFAATAATDNVTSGKYSLKINSDKEGFDPIAAQDISKFEYGKKYRLQYQARADKFGQEYRVYIGVWNDKAKGTDKHWVTGFDTQWRQGLEAWQKVSFDFTVEEPADRLMLVVQTKGPGTVWFDDISMQVAPEIKFPDPVSPYVGSANTIQIMPDRTFRVKGKPFFPILLWGTPYNTEERMAQVRDMGFNMVSPTHIDALGPDGFRLWLDTAHKFDLMVKATAYFSIPEAQVAAILPDKLAAVRKVAEAVKNHPALFAYGLADEPAWAGDSLEAFAAGAKMLREVDPNHPIFVNHAPRNTIEELRRFNQYVDIAGSDIYPVWKTGIDRHSDLPNKTLGVVGDETTKNLEALDGKKPVMQTLQGFSWSANNTNPDLKDEPFPSAEQLRFMTYHTLVRGATGVAFFQDHRYTTVRPELKPIVREMHALSDVLAGGKTIVGKIVDGPDKPASGPAAAGIETLVKESNGQLVIIAVNSSAQAMPTSFNLKALTGTEVKLGDVALQVLWENRKVETENGVIADTFAPWAVHVYTTAANESAILKPFKPSTVKIADAEKQNAVWRAGFDKLVPRGKVNLALATRGVKPTASTELGTMKAEWINDGKRHDAQWNDSTHYAYPDWAALEFPQPVSIEKIIIYSSELNLFGHHVSDGIRDFEVQVDEQGKWQTLSAIKNSTDYPQIVNLKKPAKTSKLRIWINATNGANDWSRIREIEVYGTPA